jgi:hypothetical protein
MTGEGLASLASGPAGFLAKDAGGVSHLFFA